MLTLRVQLICAFALFTVVPDSFWIVARGVAVCPLVRGDSDVRLSWYKAHNRSGGIIRPWKQQIHTYHRALALASFERTVTGWVVPENRHRSRVRAG